MKRPYSCDFCTILALIASNDWPLHQMNVKNAFLHRDIKEYLYEATPKIVSLSDFTCISFVALFMISNKFRGPGLINFAPLYYNFLSNKTSMILHCTFKNQTQVLLLFWFMLIILSLLVPILLYLASSRDSSQSPFI